MKAKKASKTNQKSRIIFFSIALTYNLLLGLYLKGFLVISPILLTFYLLSALPALFLLTKFVPIVKLTKKRYRRSISGSSKTLNMTMKQIP